MCRNNNCSRIKKKHYGRDYYRRNKAERFCVHKCPYCNYETTGAKSALKAHIYAKHTPENERPFQCPEPNCCRGFAQKGGLEKHLEKVHGKSVSLKTDREICLYIIQPGEYIPGSIKTKKRCDYYTNFPVIKANTLPIVLDNNQILTSKHLKYDAREKYISLTSYTRNQLPDLQRQLSE
tara:strand:- start:635 stop:1171 length:537 start_codon:yes stop_codon:yes gene_type:complete